MVAVDGSKIRAFFMPFTAFIDELANHIDDWMTLDDHNSFVNRCIIEQMQQ